MCVLVYHESGDAIECSFNIFSMTIGFLLSVKDFNIQIWVKSLRLSDIAFLALFYDMEGICSLANSVVNKYMYMYRAPDTLPCRNCTVLCMCSIAYLLTR